jgi:hypothetical protein
LYKTKLQVEQSDELGIDLLRAMAERLTGKIAGCKIYIRDLAKANSSLKTESSPIY